MSKKIIVSVGLLCTVCLLIYYINQPKSDANYEDYLYSSEGVTKFNNNLITLDDINSIDNDYKKVAKFLEDNGINGSINKMVVSEMTDIPVIIEKNGYEVYYTCYSYPTTYILVVEDGEVILLE